MSDTVKIQVIIEEETAYGTFRDAIYYKDMAEYEAKKADGSHEAEKSTRLDNYANAKNNPAPVVEPTKAELQSAKASLEAQIAELDVKIAENWK